MFTTDQHKAMECRCFSNWKSALCSMVLQIQSSLQHSFGFYKAAQETQVLTVLFCKFRLLSLCPVKS